MPLGKRQCPICRLRDKDVFQRHIQLKRRVSEPCGSSSSSSAPPYVGNGSYTYFAQTSSSSAPLNYTGGQFLYEYNYGSEHNGSSTGASNTYSLQINTGLFYTSYGGHTNIVGWEQFVYQTESSGTFLAVWYVLPSYSADYGGCPSGWSNYSTSSCHLQIHLQSTICSTLTSALRIH